MKRTRLFVSALAFPMALATGCARKPAPPPRPAAEVGVVTVKPERVVLTTELPGRTSPYLVAEVRPQVNGLIRERAFEEGSDVAAGALLYQIDPAPYQAAYDQTKAALAMAEANVPAARLRAERLKGLVEIRATGQQGYDDAVAALAQAEASVASARAAVESARIDLSYTPIRAPIPGRTGKSSVTVGALVTAYQPVPLVVIQQDFFTDVRLRSLIDLALVNNRDLRVATLAIEKAAALYRIQRAEVSPTVGVQALGNKYRIPEKMGDKGEAKTVSAYSVELGLASWELDLFGRLRSMNAVALEQYLGTEEARRGAQTALVAAVAGTYLTLAADGENLRLASGTLEAQTSSTELIRATRDAGIGSDLDLRQAESQVEAAKVSVAAYTGAVAVDRNALELLVGSRVAPELLPEQLGTITDPRGVSAGLSSEVLLRRPDILAAEHRLRAVNANIGAARAAFFPRISLTASYGTEGTQLSDLFGGGTRAWSFVPQIVAPLFASGSLLANLKASKVDHEIAVAQYEKAIQTAFAEVSDSLTLRTTLVAQREAQQALVAALDETWRHYDARYRAGIDGYLGVLVAQQALFNAQRGEVAVRLAEQVNLVTLYKVLGGGA